MKNVKFITTEFENYTSNTNNPWGTRKPPLFQHSDLVALNGLPLFATDFEIADKKDTVLSFSALGCCDIYINGKRLDCGELSPGWSDYNKRAWYYSNDISDLVNTGANRILAVVSPGWYAGRIAGGIYGDKTPSFACKIVNGNNAICSTDTHWFATVGGPVRTADIWDGEFYDSRKNSFEAMSRVDYSLSEWKKAEIFNYEGEVTSFIGPRVTERKHLALKPENISLFDGIEYNGSQYGKIHIVSNTADFPVKVKKGVKAVVDFGQETVGRLAIKAKGKKDVKIKMRYAEFLNDSGEMSRGNDGPKGSVYTINYRSALGKAFYVCKDENEFEYIPRFTFFGYRFVEISADDEFDILDLTAQVVGNDIEETGKIETSNPLVNKLISNIIWGQRGNYLSVPTDCPQRDERLGWTGDAQAFSITASYNANVYSFFRKWLQDIRDSQSESGGYGDISPRVGYCKGEDACAWGDAGIIIPYNLYIMFGDDSILREHFSSMEKYMDGLVTKYGYSGPIPRYGDWLAYDKCKNEFISSAYFVHDCDLMAYMSEVLGKKDKAEKFRNLRKEAQKYFNENFMQNGELIEKTQTNKILALAFNLIDDDYKLKVIDELEKQIKDNDDLLSCGFLGTYNLCPTLSKFGRDKMAYNLLLQTKEPSWLYSVLQGASTIWERWNSYTHEKGFGEVGMNSFNHYAYGAIGEWMYAYMAGIRPLKPGFREILLEPRFDLRTTDELPEEQENMKYVKASFDSPVGEIKSEWNSENGLIYKCSVPEGIKAKIVLPKLSGVLAHNGKEVAGDEFKFEVVGGEHLFEYK